MFLKKPYNMSVQLTARASRLLDFSNFYTFFSPLFPWYNTEHLHSGIDYVTLEQCHRGLRDLIVARRKADLNNQRLFRKGVNCQKQNILTEDLKPLILNFNQMTACSVINL